MTDLLTYDMLHLVLVVIGVCRVTEVVIVVLHYALCNMHTACDPNLRQTEPAGVAIGGAANLDTPAGGAAGLRSGPSRNDRGTQHVRRVPVGCRASEQRTPCARHVIAQFKREGIG